MSQTIQQKQIEYFTTYAGSCLERWNSIVGQQITHYNAGAGTVIGVKKIDDSIYIEVQFTARQVPKQRPKKFLVSGKGWNLSEVFTRLTLPREVEKDLEIRYWDFVKEDLIYDLKNLFSRPSMDQSTYNAFAEIYDQLMKTDRKRRLSEQDIQEINRCQQKLIDKMVYELRNLASHASMDQSTSNTFDEIYNQLIGMNQKRKLPDKTIQKINGYQQKLMNRKQFSDLSEKTMNPNVRAHFPLQELDEGDIQLVGKWHHPILNSLDRTSLIELVKTDKKAKWELGRLLSARSAEKVARDFYQNNYKKR